MTRTDWQTAGPQGLPLPINVSWHLWPDCNLKCTYCYATFRDIPGVLNLKDALLVLDKLHAAGTEKVTFVGGEPTMAPYLPELIQHAKSLGLITMLVTNGSYLSTKYQKKVVPFLDWVSLSIDSADPDIMAEMGRGNAKFHSLCVQRWEELSDHEHLRLKVNTVVTRLNLEDNMMDLIRRLRPARWKVFQVLPIDGQNDGKVEPLLITKDEFDAWIDRHRVLASEGLGPIAEDNGALTGTYLMLDPLGRFFHNREGIHVYTESLLQIGVFGAIKQVGWDTKGFLKRKGLYDWAPN